MAIRVAINHKTEYRFDRPVKRRPTSCACARRRIPAPRSSPTP